MAGIASPGLREILRAQWIAYWRRFSRGGAAKNNAIVLGLISIGLAAKYVSVLKGVVAQTSKGSFFELDLLAAAVFAMCISPMWDAGSGAIGPRDLTRFPLTMRERLLARIWGGLVAPVSWLALLFCATLFLPLAVAPHPACAIVAGLAFFRASFLSGYAVRDFTDTAIGQKYARTAGAVLIVAITILWLELGRASTVVLNYLPPHLLVLAAQGSWFACGVLALLAIGAGFLARYSLVWMLDHSPATVSRKISSSSEMSVLVKDLRLFRGGELKVWLILAGLVFYLATAAAPEPDAVRAVLAFASVVSIAAVMNYFGPDGAEGLDRYGLWPLNGRQVIGTKNRASVMLAALRSCPVLVLACWRFGWREGMYDSIEAAALLLASMAWGNVTSVRSPSASEEEASLFDQIIGLAASGLPGAVTIGILRSGSGAMAYAMCGMLVVCALAYAGTLHWSARYYARHFSAMRERIS